MAIQWRKSSHSGGASDEACVEVTGLPEGVGSCDITGELLDC